MEYLQQHEMNLPGAPSSNEKALMWSSGAYVESGYSTQAPSVSAFSNHNEPDIIQIGSPPPPAQEPQVQMDSTSEAKEADEDDNTIADWINYQDNSEMAIRAIPDLLKLLADEDLVVVQQAAVLLNQISRMEAPRMGLIQHESAVQCFVDCLNTTADLETARSLVGALYGISAQKPLGVQAIINSKALQPLIKILW
jgi:hypothetical protein